MNLPTVLLCLIALIFALLGMAKMLALGPAPKMAAHAGFSTTGYRVIGSLELAGAVGVTLGPVVPLFGALAATGLLLLLAGAVATHVRNGDRLPSLIPAILGATLIAGYLVLLAGTTW